MRRHQDLVTCESGGRGTFFSSDGKITRFRRSERGFTRLPVPLALWRKKEGRRMKHLTLVRHAKSSWKTPDCLDFDAGAWRHLPGLKRGPWFFSIIRKSPGTEPPLFDPFSWCDGALPRVNVSGGKLGHEDGIGEPPVNRRGFRCRRVRCQSSHGPLPCGATRRSGREGAEAPRPRRSSQGSRRQCRPS